METPHETTPADNRRGFIAQAIALVCGGVSVLIPAAVGIVAWFNPLRQKGQTGEPIKLASLAVLPEDGTPRKFPVIADRSDAWNMFPNEPIGAVFLRRTADNQVKAYQVICPHAGCSIQYESTDEGGKFFCPCHQANFALDGQRTDKTSPSPRDMDSLEAEIRNDTEVWVKFQNFETGTSKKTEKA